MQKSMKILFMTALVFALAVFAAGCTTASTPAPATPIPTAVVASQSPSVTAAPIATAAPEWIVWKEEGEKTLNALGGYFVYSPNVNEVQKTSIKVKVTSKVPVTLMYLNNTELKKFKDYVATNSGDYTPIERFDDVTSSETEVHGTEPINAVLWNKKDTIATPSVTIWYQN